MNRRALLVGLTLTPLALSACGERARAVWAEEDAVRLARYPNPGPTALTLITVRNEATRSGAHTALLIAASERVLYDPAGGWRDPAVPERHDVLFGMSPAALERYLAYQAADGYFYVAQEKAVAPEVAEMALMRAKAKGPTPQPFCVIAMADVLGALPGFQSLGGAFRPEQMANRFARLPGVVTTERHGPGIAPQSAVATPSPA